MEEDKVSTDLEYSLLEDAWNKFQMYLLIPFVQGAALGVGGQLAYYFLRWWFGYSADALPLAFPSTAAHDVHLASTI